MNLSRSQKESKKDLAMVFESFNLNFKGFQTVGIGFRFSSIQYLLSSIGFRVSCIYYPVSIIQYLLSSIYYPVSIRVSKL
jgi:hypothetical protein